MGRFPARGGLESPCKPSEPLLLEAGHAIRGLPGEPKEHQPLDPQEPCHILAGVGVPTGQDIPHLEAGLLVPIMFPLKPVLEIVRRFGNRRNCPAHELPSWPR
jgi:hypothetical protein